LNVTPQRKTTIMQTLSAARRKELKAAAHHLKPTVMIGDGGLTDAVAKEVDRALTAHELVKIHVAGDERDARIAIYTALAEQCDASQVQHIGKMLVLFRARPLDLPTAEKKAKGPHKTKKQLAQKGTAAKAVKKARGDAAAGGGARKTTSAARKSAGVGATARQGGFAGKFAGKSSRQSAGSRTGVTGSATGGARTGSRVGAKSVSRSGATARTGAGVTATKRIAHGGMRAVRTPRP
jgi:RNA-binding protein